MVACSIAENVDDVDGHSVFLTNFLKRSFFFGVKLLCYALVNF